MSIGYDLGYLGPIPLASTRRLAIACRNDSGVATAPASAPTFHIYGNSDTPVLEGSLGAADADGHVGYRTGDAAITSGNGFAAGSIYNLLIVYVISATTYHATGSFTVT